jgi:phosphoglucosamine mutase
LKSETIPKLFGTDGLRGEAGKFPLDSRTVRIIGSSLIKHLAERIEGRTPRIVIGRDTRESGDWIEQDLIAGARSEGADVESGGIITTPGVAFLARALPADAGVVISASHNPYQDNGIKVFEPSGRKLDEEMERRIEKDIAEALPETAGSTKSSAEAGIAQRSPADLGRLYLDYLADDVARGLSLGHLTLVVDCANGAACEIAPKLFERLGARIVAINNQPDGRNINRECGSLHIEGLQERVVQESADLGVAFDGDADRALFVDSRGRFVDGDATMWVLATYLKSRGELIGETVVATVMSNVGLEVALRSRGIELTRTDVGDKYVLDELIRSGATLGGEQSGHIIFPKLSLAGDGMITTVGLLRAMRDQDSSLADLTEDFKRYPQLLVNVRVREKIPFGDLLAVQNVVEKVEQQLGRNGRILLRYSGTEPLARIMIEGENQSQIEAQANALAEAVKSELGADD